MNKKRQETTQQIHIEMLVEEEGKTIIKITNKFNHALGMVITKEEE